MVDTKKDIETTGDTKIKSYECLDELKNGVESFNEYVQGSVIHLPYLALDEIQDKLELNLSGANLSGTILTGTNFTGADFTRADLTGVDISNSIIIGLQDYESIKLNEKSNFKNAISDSIGFIYHTSNFTENIPNFANNNKLKTILEKMLVGKNKQDLDNIYYKLQICLGNK